MSMAFLCYYSMFTDTSRRLMLRAMNKLQNQVYFCVDLKLINWTSLNELTKNAFIIAYFSNIKCSIVNKTNPFIEISCFDMCHTTYENNNTWRNVFRLLSIWFFCQLVYFENKCMDDVVNEICPESRTTYAIITATKCIAASSDDWELGNNLRNCKPTKSERDFQAQLLLFSFHRICFFFHSCNTIIDRNHCEKLLFSREWTN